MTILPLRIGFNEIDLQLAESMVKKMMDNKRVYDLDFKKLYESSGVFEVNGSEVDEEQSIQIATLFLTLLVAAHFKKEEDAKP